MHPNEDFGIIASTFVAGMLLPVGIALIAHSLLELYLTGPQFIGLTALAFGVVAWLLLAVGGVDRVNFLLASIALPWIIVLFVVLGGIAAGSPPGLSYLLWDFEDFGVYAGWYMFAGLAAGGIHVGIERAGARYQTIPKSETIGIGVTVLLIGLILLGLGYLHLGSSSMAITQVESGETSPGSAAISVTVSGGPAEARLTVTAPDGSSYTERIPHTTETEDDRAKVPIEFSQLGTHPHAGTYTIVLTSVAGIELDRTTHSVETPATPQIGQVTTAEPGAPIDLDLPPDASVIRPGPANEEETVRVGVVIENEGDIVDRFEVHLRHKGASLERRYLIVEPDQPMGSVFVLSDDDLERIHDGTTGNLTIEVGVNDEFDRATFQVPEG